MDEKERQEIIKAFEEIVNANEVMRKYSHDRDEIDAEPVIRTFFTERLYITEGFFSLAEALGVEPKKDRTDVCEGWIAEYYSFDYGIYSVWTSVKVRRLEDWNE